MLTHEQMVKKRLQSPVVRAEVERLDRKEDSMLDAILQVRLDAGLTQAQVA